MLQVRPVRRYASPVYPTRLEAETDPALLRKHVPASWKTLSRLSGLVTLMAAVGGCAHSEGVQPAASNETRVAPLFVHGEGRGSIGCVAVNAPTFLSEEEALQVIQEELFPLGIQFSQENFNWPVVRIKPYPQYKPGTTEPLSDVFNMDRADPTSHIAVEFVSRDDAETYGRISTDRMFLDTIYNIMDTAQLVHQKIQEQGKGFLVGVVYDPMVYTKGDYDLNDYEKREEQTRQEASRLLRLQVKDFVDWLKGQGAI